MCPCMVLHMYAKVKCYGLSRWLWLEEDEAGRGVAESGFQLDLGFLERFLLSRDDLGDLADDEIPGDKFGGFGKNVVAVGDGRETGDVRDLRGVVLKTVLAFLAGVGVYGDRRCFFRVQRSDVDNGAFDIGDGTEKNSAGN